MGPRAVVVSPRDRRRATLIAMAKGKLISRKKPAGHGGKRPGAGRKRGVFPREILDEIGPPPFASPLKMARWYQQALAAASWLFMQGQLPAATLDKIRAACGTGSKMIPDDIKFEVERLLKAEDDARGAPRDSPPTEPLDDGESLRRDPT